MNVLIDEFHVFIAPKLIGGTEAPSPIAGGGIEEMAAALSLPKPTVQQVGEDIYLHGRRSSG